MFMKKILYDIEVFTIEVIELHFHQMSLHKINDADST